MLIHAVNIGKTYNAFGIDTVALHNINLRIEDGDFVGIMGPSGCGKSTLLNLIGLLDQPSEGQLYFMGEEVSTASSKRKAQLRREKIGFVFQNFNLIDDLTIFENIELPLVYQRVSATKRRAMVENVMERLQIAHKRNYFPQQISGGQQQRVAVARAVVTRPRLILADEPTGNLDSVRGQEVMELLTQLNEAGTTIIIVTHSPTAADYSNRIINLFDGQIVSDNIAQVPRN